MKKLSRFTITAIVISALFIAFMTIYTKNALENAKIAAYNDLSQNLLADLKQEENLLRNIGIVIAVNIGDNKVIQESLIEHNRGMAIKELEKISNDYEKSTSIKNMKIHIHTADVKAFVRNWKLNKFGDDLTGFRKAILEVKRTKQPIFVFEVGRIGMTLRSIVPIIKGNKYLGSVEFIQAFENISKKFKRKNNFYLLLMNKSLLNIATYRIGSPEIGEYVLTLKSFDESFFKKAQHLSMNVLVRKGYSIDDKYLYTYKLIMGLDKEKLGMHLLGMPIKKVEEEVFSKKRGVYTYAGLAIFVYLTILLISIIFIPNRKEIKF